MRSKIGGCMFWIGLILAIGSPLYQYLDMHVKNSEGDGVQVFGDNPIFRNVLGVKTEYSFWDGQEWFITDVEIKTPHWMQQVLGLPPVVKKKTFTYSPFDELSAQEKKSFRAVWWVRFAIKLIPLLILSVGFALWYTATPPLQKEKT